MANSNAATLLAFANVQMAAEAVFKSSASTIDSIADKKIIHKNKAARHKSRLHAAIKAIGAKAPVVAAAA